MKIFLLLVTLLTGIALGLATCRFIEGSYGAGAGILIGFLTIIISFYFIKSDD